jgi:hypothetical protein
VPEARKGGGGVVQSSCAEKATEVDTALSRHVTTEVILYAA